MSNLLNPTMKEKGFSNLFNNLKQMIYQAPLDYNMNNEILNILVMQHIYKLGSVGPPEDRYISMHNYYTYVDELSRMDTSIVDPMLILAKVNFVPMKIYSVYKGDYDFINLNNHLAQIVKGVNKEICKRTIWFNRIIKYEKHRTILRLAIFDIGKKVTRPKGYYLDNLRLLGW